MLNTIVSTTTQCEGKHVGAGIEEATINTNAGGLASKYGTDRMYSLSTLHDTSYNIIG